MVDDLIENNIYTDRKKAAEGRRAWRTLRRDYCKSAE